MNSAVTLVCPETAYQKVLATVHTFDSQVSLQSNDESWDQIVLNFATGTMVLTSMIRQGSGDKFSKLILSLHNFFRTINTIAHSNKDLVLSRVANARMLIGVVAEPEFRAPDARLECLARIADELDALIFDGQAMLNAKGERIIAKNGQHDIEIAYSEEH